MVIYGLTFPSGCLVAYKVCPRLSTFPFFVCLPVYIGFGFISLIPVYLLGALVSVNPLIPLVVLGISTIIVLSERKILRNRIDTNIRHVFSPENILPLFLFIITISYFVKTVDYIRWPPAGDVMSTHGPLVSLIEFCGKLPIAPDPIIIAYPPGLHVFVATVNTLLKFYPGEAVLVVAASVIALIPPMVYSATFLATNSKLLSFVAFLATFIPHPSLHLQKWIVGYFYNGPYANLTGYLIIFAFVTAVIAWRLDLQAITWPMIKKFFPLLILTILSLLVTYPSFAIIVSLYAILAIAILYNSIKKELALVIGRFLRLNLAKKLSLVIFVSILSVIFFVSTGLHLLEIPLVYLTSGSISEDVVRAYAISMPDFFDSINGIASVIAFPCAIYLFLKKKHLWLDLFYLPLFILLLLSLNEALCRYVWIILPNRSIIIAYVLSWIIITTTVYEVERHSLKSARRIYISVHNHRFLINTRMYQVMIMLLAILLVAPSLSGYVSFELTKKLGWFQHTENFQTDFASLEWISTNVPSDALIMNDGSFISRYALSLSLKNMTNWPWAESTFPKRASDLFAIWDSPHNVPYIMRMLKRYNVSYIFSTSERSLIGQERLYLSRPYDPEVYAKIFDEYPFLEAVYKSGSTRIYKVVHTDLEFKPLLHYDIQAANTYWNDVGAWGNGTIGTPILSNTTQRIDIPSGDFRAWEIYHYFDNPTNWSDAQFTSISIGISAPRGLSLGVWDIYENYNRYDFVCGGDNRTVVFITLGSPSEHSQGSVDMAALKKIALLAGYVGPLLQPKDSLSVWEITLYRCRCSNKT